MARAHRVLLAQPPCHTLPRATVQLPQCYTHSLHTHTHALPQKALQGCSPCTPPSIPHPPVQMCMCSESAHTHKHVCTQSRIPPPGGDRAFTDLSLSLHPGALLHGHPHLSSTLTRLRQGGRRRRHRRGCLGDAPLITLAACWHNNRPGGGRPIVSALTRRALPAAS